MDENNKPQLLGQSDQPPVSGQQTLHQSDLQAKQQAETNSTKSISKSQHPDFWKRLRKGELYEDELYDIFKPYARYLKIFLQMLVAVIVTVLIILIGLSTLGVPINFVSPSLLTKKPLEIVSIALAFSTAFELAYTLFTPGPDEAVEPLITGLAAVILFLISKISTITLENTGGVTLLVLALIFLFILRELFIENKGWINRFAGKSARTQLPSESATSDNNRSQQPQPSNETQDAALPTSPSAEV